MYSACQEAAGRKSNSQHHLLEGWLPNPDLEGLHTLAEELKPNFTMYDFSQLFATKKGGSHVVEFSLCCNLCGSNA